MVNERIGTEYGSKIGLEKKLDCILKGYNSEVLFGKGSKTIEVAGEVRNINRIGDRINVYMMVCAENDLSVDYEKLYSFVSKNKYLSGNSNRINRLSNLLDKYRESENFFDSLDDVDLSYCDEARENHSFSHEHFENYDFVKSASKKPRKINGTSNKSLNGKNYDVSASDPIKISDEMILKFENDLKDFDKYVSDMAIEKEKEFEERNAFENRLKDFDRYVLGKVFVDEVIEGSDNFNGLDVFDSDALARIHKGDLLKGFRYNEKSLRCNSLVSERFRRPEHKSDFLDYHDEAGGILPVVCEPGFFGKCKNVLSRAIRVFV